jgi:hypothetical protein
VMDALRARFPLKRSSERTMGRIGRHSRRMVLLTRLMERAQPVQEQEARGSAWCFLDRERRKQTRTQPPTIIDNYTSSTKPLHAVF